MIAVLASFALGIVPLALIGAAVWYAVRAFGRRSGGQQSGRALRSVILYVLLFAALVVSAIGVAGLLGQLLVRAGLGGQTLVDGAAEAARNGAFVTVGLPLLIVLGWLQRRALRSDPAERRGFGWTAYATVASLTCLLIATSSAQACLSWWFGTGGSSDPRALGRLVVWAGVWAAHWRIDSTVTPASRRAPHLLLGSLIGLGYLAVGLANTLGASAALLLGLQERTLTDRAAPILGGLTALVVGAPVWFVYWWRSARRAQRGTGWLSYLLLTGPVAAGIAAVIGAVIALDDVLVWFLGTPGNPQATDHFRGTPYAVATALVGLLVLRYHDTMLRTAPDDRGAEVRHVRGYALGAVGVVTGAIGTGVLVTAAVDAITRSAALATGHPMNTALLGVAMLAVAVPPWAVAWPSLQRACRAEHAAEPVAEPVAAPAGPQPVAIAAIERSATSRRVYLVALTGIGSLVTLGALVTVVYLLFQDLFAGTVALTTLRGMRFGIGVLVAAALVAGYHGVVLRGEHRWSRREQHPHPRSVLLVGPHDPDLARQVSRAVGTLVDSWPRTDVEEPAWSATDVAALVDAYPDQDVLVVSDPTGLHAIPLQRQRRHAGSPVGP
jgi:hypothetical protein